MKLIDKDAVLAEINNSIPFFPTQAEKFAYLEGAVSAIDEVINSLEVTEVDLDKEIKNYNMEYVDNNGFFDTEHFAKHFFELGLRASNPLTWEDISSLKVLLDEVENEFKKGLHNDKTYIEYCEEVLKRFKERKEL